MLSSMLNIEIDSTSGNSRIMVGESLDNLVRYTGPKKNIIITDHNLNQLYHEHFPPYPVIEISTGEKIKTLDTVEIIYQQLLEHEIDRSSCIIAIGGGITCDIAGFVASTYLRGVDFGSVATSLLAQADAAIGGKNGVNFQGYKNMIGLFQQPRFVICDPILLQSLPPIELANGFAEIIKHACISNRELFSFLEANQPPALALDTAILEQLVFESVKIKVNIVNQDEKEKGERRKLNFGHTLGHALEKTTSISHGQAVSTGMVFAARLSQRLGLMEQDEVERLTRLLTAYQLPTRISFENNKSQRLENLLDAMGKDKKKDGEIIRFVLLQGIGNAIIKEIPIREIEEVLDDLC